MPVNPEQVDDVSPSAVYNYSIEWILQWTMYFYSSGPAKTVKLLKRFAVFL